MLNNFFKDLTFVRFMIIMITIIVGATSIIQIIDESIKLLWLAVPPVIAVSSFAYILHRATSTTYRLTWSDPALWLTSGMSVGFVAYLIGFLAQKTVS